MTTLHSKNYTAPQKQNWSGRVDEPQNETTRRWHQVVQLLDLTQSITLTPTDSAFAILGFASDEGVTRNSGRAGAAQGPQALRKTLANLPVHFKKNTQLFDCGDIICLDHDLESAQQALADTIATLIRHGLKPIVLGGGHEVAFGHYVGLRTALSDKDTESVLGIINFDAHFDMRPTANGANSGTPFLQIAEHATRAGQDFSYFCIGIQRASNTKHLFDTATAFGTEFIPAADVHYSKLAALKEKCDTFLKDQDAIYLTFCLDVLAASFAPGVSAPSACGILPDVTLALVQHLAKSGKVMGFDVAELSPPHDFDNQTAKLAAQIIFEFINTHP